MINEVPLDEQDTGLFAIADRKAFCRLVEEYNPFRQP